MRLRGGRRGRGGRWGRGRGGLGSRSGGRGGEGEGCLPAEVGGNDLCGVREVGSMHACMPPLMGWVGIVYRRGLVNIPIQEWIYINPPKCL